MIALTTRTGRKLVVTFLHSSPLDAEPRENAGELREVLETLADIEGARLTQCVITDETNDGYVELGVGIAKCHALDNFEKSVGRKIALTHALEAASMDPDYTGLPDGTPLLTREERTDVWNEFNKIAQAAQDRKDLKAAQRTLARLGYYIVKNNNTAGAPTNYSNPPGGGGTVAASSSGR